MGEHSSERVTLARLPSGVAVATTVHTYGTGEPTVYLQAAQHGREINGTAVLRRLHGRLCAADLDGRVAAVPVANPLTFDRVSYTAPAALDAVNPNMNRVWPGDPDGSLHERMAARLWEHVEDAAAVVDLHTASPAVLPHVVVTEGHGPSRALADAFGTDLHLLEPAGEDAGPEWNHRNFAGKLRVAAARAGVPTVTPELGPSGRIDEAAVERGVEGLLDVLREAGVLSGSPDPAGDPTLARNHLGRVRAADSGLFRQAPEREPGERIDSGSHLGTLYDPTSYEVLQEPTADRPGVLYSLRAGRTAVAGETLAGVAEPLD